MCTDDDRRLQGQERYLQGVVLYWKRYTRYSETWDHDHCDFCWATFSDWGDSEHLIEGYATADDYYWICPQCLADFKERFQWRLGSSSSPGRC